MVAALALLEAGSLFAAVWGTLVLWGQPVLAVGPQLAGVLSQVFTLCLCCLTAFYFNDLYDLRVVRSFGEFAPRLVQSVGISLILVATFSLCFPKTGLAERRFVSSLIVVAGLVIALRAMSYAIMRSRRFVERVLILGQGPLAETLIAEVEAQPHRPYMIVGLADNAGTPERIPEHQRGAPSRWLGPLSRLEKIIEETRPHRIVIGLRERRGRLPVRQLLEAQIRGIHVEDGLMFYERLTGKLAIEALTPSTLVFSGDFRKSRLEPVLGRGLSLLVSIVALIALAPLLALIAIAIKADSPGPIFFLHTRVSLNGRLFRLIKFRTMHPTNGTTSEWVRDNSDRITHVGKWLRKFRLDELPQFVNILCGDMNLVGPRPHPVSNFQLFTDTIPYYSLRSTVRPGATGWAQIRYGYANDLREETEKMRYDLFYIKHLSFWLDIRILFETVKTVLFGREQPGRASGAPATEAASATWVPRHTPEPAMPIDHGLPSRLATVPQPVMSLADHENGRDAKSWTRAA